MRRALSSLVLHALLIASAALVLLPLVWMGLASLAPEGTASAGLLPTRLTLEHHARLVGRLNLARHLGNSALVAASVTGISLLFNSLAGYAFAKLRFRGRERLERLLLAALVVPAQVGMLPLFLMVRELGLINTWAGVILPGVASIFGIFLMRQYALSIPDSLLDAARIDGAGELRIWWSVVLPWCRPILVTLAAFTFVGTWNDFLWPLVVLSDADMYTLPVALANLLGEHVQDVELMLAGSVLTVLPVLVLFLLLQRHYIEGIAAGALRE
jgi:multiple sugar transport system permease protein